MMKRLYLLLLPALILFAGCGGPKSRIDRTTENGVEVVLNHLTPYPIGKVRAMTLERLSTIDTESAAVRDAGLFDIFGFDVDSQGQIFVLKQYAGEGDFVFLFDDQGRFLKSFGRKGQGPGEIQNPHYLTLDDRDHVLVWDVGHIIRFDKDGGFMAASTLVNPGRVLRGPGGSLLLQDTSMNPEGEKMLYSSTIKRLDAGNRELGALDSYKVLIKPDEINPIEPSFGAAASRERIFVANESRGYEIRVFDRDGALVRIIRKEYQPVPVSEAYREKILKQFGERFRGRLRFPANHAPFQSLTADENGRLLVATYEPGDKPGEYLYDIFDEDGVFVGRKSLNAWIWEGALWIRMKADKLYALQEKDNGFKEIVVYRLKWE
ncbi:MAG: 6-bladed beta-propeller [Acidobacteriota bacterium]|nr:6-bladed beta-propeller [Acidobacteriota bacterium]